MHPEVEELRPKLKEILYDCAVELKATKAALYLLDEYEDRFELATEYGFRGTPRVSLDRTDPFVDRCARSRSPFFANGLTADPRYSEILFEAGTDRFLVVPLYSRGAAVGMIDMRDKAGKLPFEESDIPAALRIAERTMEVFAPTNVFGIRVVSLSEREDGLAARVVTEDWRASRQMPVAAAVIPPGADAGPRIAVLPMPVTQPQAAPKPPSRLGALIREAKFRASRITTAPLVRSLGDADLDAVRDVLRAVLLLPGAQTAGLTALSAGMQEIAARSTLTDEAQAFLQAKFQAWLSKRGEAPGVLRTEVTTPLGIDSPPITSALMQKVFTAPVTSASVRGLYLTVTFSSQPDRAAHEMLSALLTMLQRSIERNDAGTLRARVAEALLEPDFSRFPELRKHCEGVAKLVEAFTRSLGWSSADVENARLVAMVHDVGMRLLDYGQLYRKRELTEDEMNIVREHSAVGAALVEPLLGAEIARAVLYHHERADGRGYPDGLRGEQIPLLARVVQICDAWIAMTDPESYQTAIPPAAALGTIARAAGTQFDAELASRFVHFIR